MKKAGIRLAVIVFWLMLWQLAALWIDNSILIAGPFDVLRRLLRELGSRNYYRCVFGSLLRILAGFALGMCSAVAAGIAAFRFAPIKALLEPLVLALKSVPVAAFVVLVLIWSGSKNLAVPICFAVVFPYFYIHTLAGLGAADKALLEAAKVFGMRGINKIMFIYRPALAPYFASAVRVTVGMGFKSGVAAEVIGIPAYSIGGRMYLSKVWLDIEGVLAWTVTVVLLSFVCEKLILFLFTKLGSLKIRPLPGKRHTAPFRCEFPAMQKTYADDAGKPSDVCASAGCATVISLPELSCAEHERIALVGASGSGKTTYLRMLAGLVRPDGEYAGGKSKTEYAVLFQEDRLCMELSADWNVRTVCAPENTGMIRQELLRLLPPEALDKPAGQLSGGMRRRAAAVRAALSGGNALLLDEPFTGLDEENRRSLAEFLLSRQQGRPMIYAVHGEDEAALLKPDQIIHL